MDEEYDYIIIGAGSAGCVVANKLSADATRRVLLLEAGGRDRNPLIHMPKGFGKLTTDPKHAWHFAVRQAREPGVPPREVWVGGRVLGGSSSINGMIYTRGQPEDYDGWRTRGWGWAEMKPIFKALEDHELGADDLRGVGGPVHVSASRYAYPLTEKMIAAGEQLGLKRRDDLNREDQEGVGYYLHTIKNGRRISAAEAFLRPAEKRSNLDVRTGVVVDRILFDGKRAVGAAGRAGGVEVAFRARGEVIVSCGVVRSPLLLQWSGVGPGAHLRSVGVDVVHDSANVGARVRDHLGLSLSYRLKGDPGINSQYYGFGLAKNVLRYGLFRSGPMACGPFEVGAYVKSDPSLRQPDVQIYLGAITIARGEDNFAAPTADLERLPGITISGSMLHLTSSGAIRIASADADAPPEITPNWLTTPEDQRVALATFRLMRRYMAQPALSPYLAEELPPWRSLESDEEIAKVARITASSSLHAVGSCGMGDDDAAVTDARLRVRGVENLRVVDCSAMPGLISGNTNAPAMALAWRASQMIIEDGRALLARKSAASI